LRLKEHVVIALLLYRAAALVMTEHSPLVSRLSSFYAH
jgi:hypothetical protein